ncbi:polysaccharide pyruvyl transferase family protein [Colwellia sp. D2M02]|uniref:polysaccharide pyruvyl transferase family protein n=1 Tax=Colwellia sp. D2M02 TaxID=2841562 RepID=UPI001C0A56FF|nr:polysaccharide pyruvyl transferase family protein [Colwellia sp. D2M02]MBU2891950.1 polysaccharide pyruvyl transferase family protein [Colwellia sp. D2M02]
MLNIEIKGVQFSNKGAELMLVAILEQLDKELGEYQITLSPGPHLPYQQRARLGAWQKLSFRRGKIDLTGFFAKLPTRLLNFFKRYGLVTEKDVDVILDASGFAYGEQWGVKSLAHTAKEVARFHQQGKKYIFLPQALGPFYRANIRDYGQTVFSKASLVFPRDDSSYQAVTELLVNQGIAHVIQSPDFTCLVEPELHCSIEKSENQAQTLCIIPNNKMVSKFHHENASVDEQSYLDFLVNAGKHYQGLGWQVVLLNHEGHEDQAICQKIAEQLSGDITIKQGLSAVGIKAYIGEMDAVLSSRFHGCVSALIQGVPCLATSWSHKYQMLFQEYGVSDNVLDFKMTKNDMVDQCTVFNDSLTAQKTQCLTHAQLVKEQTRNMWKQVFTILKA